VHTLVAEGNDRGACIHSVGRAADHGHHNTGCNCKNVLFETSSNDNTLCAVNKGTRRIMKDGRKCMHVSQQIRGRSALERLSASSRGKLISRPLSFPQPIAVYKSIHACMHACIYDWATIHSCTIESVRQCTCMRVAPNLTYNICMFACIDLCRHVFTFWMTCGFNTYITALGFCQRGQVRPHHSV
jgi:hypothetical protein